MDEPRGVGFSFQLTGGRYPGLRPRFGSLWSIVGSVAERGHILQRLAWSCLVLSCLIVLISWHLEDGPEWFDVTSSSIHREKKTRGKKACSSPCAAEEVYFGQSVSWCQIRHSLRGVNHEQAEWSSLTPCQNSHSCSLMYPHSLTAPNFWQLGNTLRWIHSHKTQLTFVKATKTLLFYLNYTTDINMTSTKRFETPEEVLISTQISAVFHWISY